MVLQPHWRFSGLRFGVQKQVLRELVNNSGAGYIAPAMDASVDTKSTLVHFEHPGG